MPCGGSGALRRIPLGICRAIRWGSFAAAGRPAAGCWGSWVFTSKLGCVRDLRTDHTEPGKGQAIKARKAKEARLTGLSCGGGRALRLERELAALRLDEPRVL